MSIKTVLRLSGDKKRKSRLFVDSIGIGNENTKKGDGGETSDLKGGRVSKGGATIEVVGAFDELMVWIGLVIAGKDNPDDTLREEIQRLIYLSAGLLVGDVSLKTSVSQKNQDILIKIESAIDTTEYSLHVLSQFIIPQKS